MFWYVTVDSTDRYSATVPLPLMVSTSVPSPETDSPPEAVANNISLFPPGSRLFVRVTVIEARSSSTSTSDTSLSVILTGASPSMKLVI